METVVKVPNTEIQGIGNCLWCVVFVAGGRSDDTTTSFHRANDLDDLKEQIREEEDPDGDNEWDTLDFDNAWEYNILPTYIGEIN